VVYHTSLPYSSTANRYEILFGATQLLFPVSRLPTLSAIASKYVKALPKANDLLLQGSHASSDAATQQVDDEVRESRFASLHAFGKTTTT